MHPFSVSHEVVPNFEIVKSSADSILLKMKYAKLKHEDDSSRSFTAPSPSKLSSCLVDALVVWCGLYWWVLGRQISGRIERKPGGFKVTLE